MKKQILFFLSLLIHQLSIGQAINPYVIASAGGYFNSSNVQLSWTLGELVTSTFNSGNFILTQGFQQNSYINISVKETENNPFKLIVFPNPAENIIYVSWEYIEETDLIIEITDYHGKNVYSNIVNSSKNLEIIDIKGLASSVYMLHVTPVHKSWKKHLKFIKYR